MEFNKPAVIITGDVHHYNPSLMKEQSLYEGNEPAAAVKYAKILNRFGLQGTLFYTGLCFKEARDEINAVASMKHMELGGHTYNCYQPKVMYKIWRHITGNANGPKCYQARDVQKTLNAADDMGINIKSWRNHAYREDKNTLSILAEKGITHVSNKVAPDSKVTTKVMKDGKVLSLGINVWPDHEHMLHGYLTKEEASHRQLNRNKFPNIVFKPKEWVAKVIESVETLQCNGQHAVLLVHPGCMMTLGNWDIFNQLCKKLSEAKFVTQKMCNVEN